MVSLTGSTVAQAPAGAPAGPPPDARGYPPPTNLKVLPKETTGRQVHEIMREWERSLGIQCGSCHAEDPDNLGPDGRPLLNFAADSKPMKSVARAMYAMTDQINQSYLAKIDGSGVPLTCGTCHRGHLEPEPFLTPREGQEAAPPRPPDAEKPLPE
jgi:hypothetical protein